MKRIYFSLLVLAMMMVSTVAKAQFEGTIEMYPATNYNTKSVDFPLADVARVLETEPATLKKAIDNWVNEAKAVGLDDITNLIDEYLTEGSNVSLADITNLIDMYLSDEVPEKAILYIGSPEDTAMFGGETADQYTANGFGSSWMNMQGMVVEYGDTEVTPAGDTIGAAKVYNDFAVDLDSNYFEIQLGQYPDRLVAGDIWTGKFTLVYGGKNATFTVRLQVVERPAIEIASLYSELEFVKEYADSLTVTEGKSYEGATLEIDMSDLADALGADAEVLSANIENIVLTRRIESENDSYFLGDSIFAPSSLAANAWFGRYSEFDEATGNETLIQQNAPLPWSSKCTYYVNSYKLEDGKFSLTYGQYPNTMKAGDNDFIELYIVNGTKAAKLTLFANVKPQPVIPQDQMVKVGEATVAVTANVDNNYTTKGFTIDMEAVVAALGCTTDDLEDVYAWAAEGQMSDNHTEGSGGFFFNADGYIEQWGSNAAFYVARTETSLQDGKFTVGQMPNTVFADLEGEKTVKGDLIFQYKENYYIVTLEYTVKGKEPKPEDFVYKLVSEETLSIQIVPGNNWAWETKSTLDLDYIKSKIGTDDFVLYTDKADSVGNLQWSNNYTCTPAPGFWYGTTTYENEEHQVVVDNAGWGTNSFGITYADGEITWYQYPGQRTAGDSYLANIYLANDETGDYIKYTLYVRYVDEVVPEAEVAGQEEVTVLVSPDLYDESYGGYLIALDMTAAYDTLGISDELIEACSVIVPKSQTVFETTSTDEAIFYNTEGYSVSPEDESAVISASLIINDEGKPALYVDDFTSFFDVENATTKVRIGLEYDGKRYLHIITLTNVPANE